MDYARMLEKVEEVVDPVVKSLGFDLAEREFLFEGRWVLRLTIDREGGTVTIGDCETVSRAVEGVLDVEALIPHSYVLEVSSPGEERPLRKQKDFERFAGNGVEIKTKELVDGRRHFTGRLKGLQGDKIVIVQGGQEWRVPLAVLKKAKIKHGGLL